MGRDALVLPLAHEQHGLVSRVQALRAGMAESAVDRRVRVGEWDVVAPGVYRLPVAAPTWHQRALSVCLQGAPHAALSHRSAAYVWRLDTMRRGAPEPLEVVIPRGRRLQTVGAEVRATRFFERGLYRKMPVTPLSRTLIDLAPTLPELELEMALDSALRFGPRALFVIRQKLKTMPRRGREGLAVLEELLEAHEQTRDSALEVVVQKLLWAAGLPKPVLHYNVWHDKKWLANVDFAWPAQKLAVQAYGLKDHLKRRRYRIDQRQEAQMQAAGWVPLPVTWDEATNHPARFIECAKQTWARVNWQRSPSPATADAARTTDRISRGAVEGKAAVAL